MGEAEKEAVKLNNCSLYTTRLFSMSLDLPTASTLVIREKYTKRLGSVGQHPGQPAVLEEFVMFFLGAKLRENLKQKFREPILFPSFAQVGC